jgi:4-amino-4-deoxy-L-arabinose transferase-like glycosyltransferase
VKFNHDVIQLPIWAAAGLALFAGLRTGALRFWLLLGAALGLALWAKYFVVMIAIPIALFMLFDRDARKAWRRPGPWVAIVVALIVAAPHVWWLVEHDFAPLHYVDARARSARTVLDYLLNLILYPAGQLFFLLPSLLIACPLFIRRSKRSSSVDSTNFEFRIVTMLTFGPALTLLAFAVLSGRAVVAMWGYPLWLFLGLWLVMLTASPLQPLPLARAVALWIVALVCYVIAFIADYAILPYHDIWIRASLYPGRALAANVVDGFERVTGRKLHYVIGSMWDAGNAAHYSPQAPQPHVVIESIERSPWIDLADLRKQGAVVIWTIVWRDTPNDYLNDYLKNYLKDVPSEFKPIAYGAKVQTPFRLDCYRGANVVYVGWAIIPPNPAGDARRLKPGGAVSPADTALHGH